MDVKKLTGYMLVFAFAAGMVTSSAQSRRSRRQRSSITTSRSQAVASAPKVTIPSTALAGKQFTVQNLASLINTFNSAGTSDFLILTADGRSTSASLAGYDWRPYQGEVVTLQADPNRIATLNNNHCFLDTQTQQNYQNSMVWFSLPQFPNVAFYLIDPNPGRNIAIGGVVRSPAANIIDQWAKILEQRAIIRRFQ